MINILSKITRKNLEVFLARYSTEKRVLDIGSGGSSYDSFFPNRVTVDIDPARHPEIVGDAHNLPFENNEFEVVLCTEVLEHLEDPRKALEEMRRVLRPGGTLLLTTRFVFPLHDTPNDFWRFTKFGLKKLFEKWEVQEIVSETRTFSAIGALLQRIVFQDKMRMNRVTKVFLLVLAWVCDHLNWLIVLEYGNAKKREEEANIMTTGYYVVAQKN